MLILIHLNFLISNNAESKISKVETGKNEFVYANSCIVTKKTPPKTATNGQSIHYISTENLIPFSYSQIQEIATSNNKHKIPWR
jgi:hypothetical protein